LKSKREVHVIGANWEMYGGKDKNYLKLHEQVNYDILPKLIADTKVMFNTQPLFMDGPHDRVMNAIMNGTVALTDKCDYLDKHFSNNVDIVFYRRDNMERLPQIIEQIFDSPERLEHIAWKGYQKALSEHTWHIRVEDLIRHISF
jgi:spore maturation protein CgeB